MNVDIDTEPVKFKVIITLTEREAADVYQLLNTFGGEELEVLDPLIGALDRIRNNMTSEAHQ